MVRLEFRNGSLQWWNPLSWWCTRYYPLLDDDNPIRVTYRGRKMYVFIEPHQETRMIAALEPFFDREEGESYTIGRTLV